ncbi:right-handed parallel beta-helix repeat-containing protein [bacterium]|nr:right-handed parallel beta-helix repeat-containing protein [bacterium]
MKKKLFMGAFLLCRLLIDITIAYGIPVTGWVYLENKQDYSGISVYLNMVTPSSTVKYIATTDSTGMYSLDVQSGIYTLGFKKTGYRDYTFENQILISGYAELPGIVLLLAYPRILSVPAEFSKIQSAVNMAVNGDTVLVSPGKYVGNVDFKGKSIILGSLFFTTRDTTYISQTIIDAGRWGSVVAFKSGEDSTSVMEGFTLTNGAYYSDYGGGGILCFSSSPRLSHLIITGNWTAQIQKEKQICGGGIYAYNSHMTLSDIVITNNTGYSNGGGIYCYESDLRCINLTVSNNSAKTSGGGIYCDKKSNMTIENCTITGNESYSGGGIFNYSKMTISNSIIDGNTASMFGGGIYTGGLSSDFLHISNAVITKNKTLNDRVDNVNDYSGGGGIFLRGTVLTLKNVTIVENYACMNGCGIHIRDSNSRLYMENSIVAHNRGDYGIYAKDACIYQMHYCDFSGNEKGNIFNNYFESAEVISRTNANGDSCDLYNNIYLDPIFDDHAGGDFHLSSYSPLIGAGTVNDTLKTDIEGKPRGEPPDIGAYENPSSAPDKSEVMVDGNALLHEQDNHEDITVSFINDDTSHEYGNITTNMNGDFSVSLKPGRYNIYFRKDGYYDNICFDVEINGSLRLEPVVLYPHSKLLTVPSPAFRTIRAALDQASPGDTILVAEGTYPENIDFNGKSLVVGSLFLTTQDTTYIRKTVISGEFTGDVVNFVNGEDSTSVLTGFTLTSGINNRNVICCNNSNPIINNLIITRNEYDSYKGYGIYCNNASPDISNVLVWENNSNAMYFENHSNPTVHHVTLHEAEHPWSPMGNSYEFHGIVCMNQSSPLLTDIFFDHTAASSIQCIDHSNPTINRVSVIRCSSSGIYCKDSSPVVNDVTIIRCYYAGIYCNDSSPVVDDVTIQDIYGYEDGAGTGFYCTGSESHPYLNNVRISDCESTGILCDELSEPVINNVLITHAGSSSEKHSTGISIVGSSRPVIRNVTITDMKQSLSDSYGIRCSEDCIPDIANVIVTGSDYGVYNDGGNPQISYSSFSDMNEDIFYGLPESYGVLTVVNANGDSCDCFYNIFGDPHFTDDYRLRNTSPCIGAGTSQNAPPYDITGALRGTPPDMGAYENPALKPVMDSFMVRGYAYLNGMLSHSGITVSFVNADTSKEAGRTTTSENGEYSIFLKSGTYTIKFRHQNFYGQVLYDIKVYNDITAESVTLLTCIMVPSAEYKTIQSAIDNVFPGDTVLVKEGIYPEEIDFKGKSIVVGSLFMTTQDTTYIGRTIISGGDYVRTVIAVSGEDSTSVLNGFTLRNDHGLRNIIYCKNSSPLLENLTIRSKDEDSYYGLGLFCYNASPIVMNLNNVAGYVINAFQIDEHSNPRITNSIIKSGGIEITNGSCPVISDVIIHASSSYGIRCVNSNPVFNRVSILSYNEVGVYSFYSDIVANDMVIIANHGNREKETIGIYCSGSSCHPKFNNIAIRYNNSYNAMGICSSGFTGIKCLFASDPVFSNVVISHFGGENVVQGMEIKYAEPIIRNVTIADVVKPGTDCYGIRISGVCVPDIANVIITGTDYGIYNEGGSPAVSNSAFWDIKKEVFYGMPSAAGIVSGVNANGDSCDISGNILKDPLLFDDFRLPDSSPCIGAGTPEKTPLFDITGAPRGTLPDMGAYENPLERPSYWTGINAEDDLPETLYLYPCSPNPFNLSTTITFALPADGYVHLTIFNIEGQNVRELVADRLQAGKHHVIWDGKDDRGAVVSSGIYFPHLAMDSKVTAGKMLLIK